MAKDACLECGKTLPANKELASVPTGRLVAFDPDANRVWRICAKCHHWNLLGPEASAAAMPELLVRFASQPSAGPEGLAKAKVSEKLDLFQVGGAQERAARILALIKAKHEVVSSAVKGLSIIFVAFWSVQLYQMYHAVRVYGMAGVAGLAIATGTVGLFLRGTDRDRNRYDRHLPIPLLLLGLGMTAAGFLTLKWAGAAILVGLVLTALGRFDERHSDTLDWTPGQGDLRFGKDLPIRDVPSLLDPDVVTAEQAADAIDLFESLGSLHAALLHVSERHGVPEGRLRLRDLSDQDRLLLAIAVRVEIVEPPHEVTAGLPDARAIAEVAESLDQPRRGA